MLSDLLPFFLPAPAHQHVTIPGLPLVHVGLGFEDVVVGEFLAHGSAHEGLEGLLLGRRPGVVAGVAGAEDGACGGGGGVGIAEGREAAVGIVDVWPGRVFVEGVEF